MLRIVHGCKKDQIQHIRELFTEYAASLDFDLSFQNYEKEYAELPGEYTPPNGRLLLAIYGTEIAGCVALRSITEDICEMKRLYVRPNLRGKGIGRSLAMAIIEAARKIGYSSMRLDTVPSMKGAVSLYQALGFKNIKPYRYNPIGGAQFMQLSLKKTMT